ncbi:DUF1620-domain-containing protein [Gloeophyllum trabeum ATCC 11539]|uniref:ER membrane protein complex subunit 1 n=1 Tax=Gloeophyllum trabeum (strain ATCC 11539 / FP-39264 / Madison 617) TaxID=670483 RepID=S7Q685_GLOTA|nr:DUF1620-domain-containing protein [Gloeophyllum trabeum ATCC 11539]EPQ55571.1 DUF1620-domain-containing protein [Gloeophyllum trabeum ATCC 11539]
MLLSLLAVFAIIGLTSALHASEAGVVDWQKSLVGVPLTYTTSLSPAFHRVHDTVNTTRSVILTATGNNVLAALDPVDGSVAVAALSGPGGATLRIFDALTGQLLLENRLHAPSSGHLSEPIDLGTALSLQPTENTRPHIFVLTNGHSVRLIDGSTGDMKWGWTSADQTSKVIYTKLVATSSTVYLIGLSKSIQSNTLHITSLSASTGELIEDVDVPSNIAEGPADIIPLTSVSGAEPRLAWFDRGAIRSMLLTPDLKDKPASTKEARYRRVIDVNLGEERGIFVAIQHDGSARVFRIDEEGPGVKAIWEFADSADSGRYAPSIYSGGLDKEGNPYVSRVFWSHVLGKASVHVFAPHLADGKGLVSGFAFPFDTRTHGIINHVCVLCPHMNGVAVDNAHPGGFTVLTRLFVTTTTGAVQFWQRDVLEWTREESLASISAAEFVDLPEEQVVHSHNAESFVQRVVRHIIDAKDFPRYLAAFVNRFLTGSYETTSSVLPSAVNASGLLTRDTFGFRKVIVAATGFGKIYGLDSSTGDVLWSRILGLGWAAEVGAVIRPLKIYVTRTVADGDTPQVVVVTQRRAENTLVDTVLFHIDALTGEDARGASPSGEVLQGLDIISGPLVDMFFLPGEKKVVVLIDEFLGVHLYPDNDESQEAFTKVAKSLYLPLRAGVPGNRRLVGHQVHPNPELHDHYFASPIWTTDFPASEDVLSIIRPSHSQPVASLGKVLGNRTTLYKYLNPNLLAVVTASKTVSKCSIYVVDSVKGSILYHVSLPAPDGDCDVKANLVENWLVYTYYNGEGDRLGQTKGQTLVSVEFYEGNKPDDKTRSSDISSYSEKSTHITAYEQAFLLPHGITALSSTATKFGITTKDIIVAYQNNQIQSIPRRLLDPRRPKRKPTSEEMEEMLIQYDPLLPYEPRAVLSHNYQVANVQRVITSPALLESTSLVFAYGLDLFHTRVTPSGTFDVLSENFNKAQLVFTVGGLLAAIIITKPMVQRKKLRERWYQ